MARMEIRCGEEKGCFGSPSGCVKNQKCAMLATYKYIHVPVDHGASDVGKDGVHVVQCEHYDVAGVATHQHLKIE